MSRCDLNPFKTSVWSKPSHIDKSMVDTVVQSTDKNKEQEKKTHLWVAANMPGWSIQIKALVR